MMFCDVFRSAARLATDVTHHVVHEFRQSPRLTQSKQGMPMIRHYDERTEINALLLNSKRETLKR